MQYNNIYEFDRMRSILDDLFYVSNRKEYQNEVLEYTNIYENQTGYMLQFLAPGVKQDDIQVNCSNGMISVSIKRILAENDIKEKTILRHERSGVDFTRSYRLSEDADTEKIEAKMVNGILMVFIPKKEKAKPRKIAIKVK